MALKRLKIVEQIIIISLIGVLVPSLVSWLIINNINQHSLREELGNSAKMIAGIMENNIMSVFDSSKNRLDEIIISLKYIPNEEKQNIYLKDTAINSETFKEFEIIRPSEHPEFDVNKKIIYNPGQNRVWIVDKIHDDKYLKAEVNIEIFKNNIFNNFEHERNRRIYIVDKEGKLLFSHNFDAKDFNESRKQLPVNLVNDIITRFEVIKNQPRVYLKLDDIGVIIIVNTSENLTKATIYKARIRILLAFLIAGAITILLTLLYSYYLYFNIRQLFKGIIAVARGNYKKIITPLTNIFTPREIIFLSEEFNCMVDEINSAYKELQEKNKELKLLDSFRSNLVDTVSHELRTPLTSIRGYTSRLLRTDIKIDEETKHKSLLIIKRQSERLSRMIEDLLVIPDIEGAKLNIILDRINLLNVIENSIYSLKNIEQRELENNVSNDFPDIYADKDRLEQVIINILNNADKYAYENTPIKINAVHNNETAEIEIINKANYIEEKVLGSLFDKFIRLDDKTTRTTRGTGLGLYIVKGLTEAMNGKVYLSSSKDNTFSVKIVIPLYKDNNHEN